MKEVKIDIKVPPVRVPKKEKRKYNPNLPDPHYFLGLISGSRGSGKTQALIEFLSLYDKDEVFDDVFLFCPTIANDDKYALLENMSFNLHAEEDYSNAKMTEVINFLQKRLDNYKIYQKRKKIYELFASGKPVEKFSMGDLMTLKELNFMPPPNDFPKGKPNNLLIFDDLQYNKDLYSNTSSKADDPKKFFIRHRHKCCNVLFLTQSFINGVPKQVRSNLNLMILFANKSPQMKKTIADELASMVSKEDFIAMWDYATKEDFGFLKIDYEAAKGRKWGKNWDTFLTM